MSEINSAMFDSWTIVHGLTGLGLGLLGVGPKLALPSAVAYEVIEYAHEWPKGSLLFGSKRPESFQNIAADLSIFTMLLFAGLEVRKEKPLWAPGAVVLVGAAALAYGLMPDTRLEPAT